MSNLNDLKDYLRNNPEEALAVLDSERASIYNTPEIKILHGKYLSKFWEERPNKLLTFVLYFEESFITNLNFENVSNNLDNIITETLKTSRIIKVDSDFGVISSISIEIKLDYFENLSNTGNIVFFFGEGGIDVIVRGKIFPRINVFYDESDRLQYYKKYHICNLPACLKEYEIFIKSPGINEAFFASKKLVARIRPTNTPNNTLFNKPESILRDNLLTFLNDKTQHSFSKENELNNRRELDLYTEVDGKKYLIEVKWLGQTIDEEETGFTHNVTDHSARKGVTQTLQYIKQLLVDMSFNLHCGYLCVFDAREIKNPINYRDFNFIPEELLPYVKHFIKLDEIPISRNP